jgi:hypothetical protein
MFTSKFLINFGFDKLLESSKDCINSNKGSGFSPQIKAYASKPKLHLRRTSKLDPLAECFIYDLVYRNRGLFPSPESGTHKHFGYRFDENDKPISPTDAYGAFRKAQSDYERNFTYSLTFDVASYFNSLRHDDIVEWCYSSGIGPEDTRALDVFLEQSNSGRGADCWPQGIYPAKMIGNAFLRFAEENSGLKCSSAIRFLDDFVLFSDDKEKLVDDFFLVQKLLGSRGLSINPSKTRFSNLIERPPEAPLSETKKGLLEKSREATHLAYAEDFDDAHVGIELDNEELDYIRNILSADQLNEEDSELILSVSRNHPDEIKPYLEKLFISSPHLSKRVWSFFDVVTDMKFTEDFLSNTSRNSKIQEYQLFWIAQILADHAHNIVSDGGRISSILQHLYRHPNATDLSKAKLLEIEFSDPTLMEWRREHLLSGRSDWMAWASAIGHRKVIQNSDVKRFSSFPNSSQINKVIFDIIRSANEKDPDFDDLPAF